MSDRTPDSPGQLARLWAISPAPVEGPQRLRRIRPEIEAEIAEWVRYEVDRRSRRYGEEEEG